MKQNPPFMFITKSKRLKFLFEQTTKIAFFILCTMLVFSCQNLDQDDTGQINQPTDEEILTFLEESGFYSEHLTFEESYILYEDVVLDKESVIYDMINGFELGEDEDIEGEVEGRQRGVTRNNVLTNVNSKNGIKIWIAPSILSDCGPKVKQGIYQAAGKINQIHNITINIQFVSQRSQSTLIIASDLDLDVFDSDSPFYQIPAYSGLANLSGSGKVGKFISIDPTWETLPEVTIRSGMMHEICHTIGFHHTDGADGVHIHGTPAENSSSIMNPTVPNTGLFTYFDQTAVRMYYAAVLSKPTNITVVKDGDEAVVMYKNPKRYARPYYWIRVIRYDMAGRFDGYKDFKASVNGSGVGRIVWDEQPSGQYKYRLKAMRYRKDIKSPLTGAVAPGN